MLSKSLLILPAALLLVVLSFTKKRSEPPLKKKYKPEVEMKRFADSLVKSGIDSIIIYCGKCSDCKIISESQFKYPASGEPEESLPSYVFWIKAGKYYLTKCDQYFWFKSIQSSHQLIYPLFDYFTRNKKIIIEKEEVKDPTEVFNLKDSIKKGILYTNYLYLHRKVSLMKEYSDVEMKVITKGMSEEVDICRYPVQPNYIGFDSMSIGNTNRSYYYNLSLPRHEWLRLIESTLFMFEVKQLWQKVD